MPAEPLSFLRRQAPKYIFVQGRKTRRNQGSRALQMQFSRVCPRSRDCEVAEGLTPHPRVKSAMGPGPERLVRTHECDEDQHDRSYVGHLVRVEDHGPAKPIQAGSPRFSAPQSADFACAQYSWVMLPNRQHHTAARLT